MTLTNLPDVLHEMGGEIRVVGHRISLFHIISAHTERGIGLEMMGDEFPTLTPDEIDRVWAYYQANRAEVDEFVREYRAEIDRQEAMYTRKGPTREELLARLPPEIRQLYLDRRPTPPRPAGEVPRAEAG